MSKDTKTIGDRELDLLRWIAERGDASVGEAAHEFGVPRDLARSTVMTMMDRLRKKGHLQRRRRGGVYRYSSPSSSRELLQGVVHTFVESTLGGSVSPFVTYLVESDDLSDREIAELEQLVESLHSKRGNRG
jgi:predicted transcriptional regulator